MTTYENSLQYAMENKHYNLVQAFLEHGLKLNDIQVACIVPNAAAIGHTSVLKTMRRQGYNFGTLVNTALLEACAEGHVETVQFLLDVGAKIDLDNDKALEFAVHFSQFEVVKVLLQNGASVANCNLMFALHQTSDEIKDYLHNWGDFFTTVRNSSEYSEQEKKRFAVFVALDRAKTLEEVKSIVTGLTTDEINWLNSPCLDGLVFDFNPTERQDLYIPLKKENEYIETYKYLLNKNMAHMTIGWATKHGFLNTIKLLLSRGKNVYSEDICQAIDEKRDYEIVKLLLDNAKGVMDNTDITRKALYRNDENILRLLVENNFSFIMKQAANVPYLALMNKYNSVKILIEIGIDIHVDDSALFISACHCGCVDIAKLLLDNGANIHARDGDALHTAVFDRNTKLVELLLEYGACAHLYNTYNLATDKSEKSQEIARLLNSAKEKNKNRACPHNPKIENYYNF